MAKQSTKVFIIELKEQETLAKVRGKFKLG
jgi:hypothetical protein